jgi:hypothetical protein
VLSQGRIGMGRDLGAQGGMLGGRDLGRPAAARAGRHRAALAARLLPTPNRPGVDAEPSDDLGRGFAGVDGGQGVFTEIGGVMRAFHAHSVSNGHIIRNPL